MQIDASSTELVIQAPAKLNLFFEVLAKRSDGFHEIETLMVPINLYDTLYFREEPGGQLELKCQRASSASANHDAQPDAQTSSGDGADAIEIEDLPNGNENLVVRAAELLRERTGVRSGVSMRLVKRIPIASGLGGGSSDAAAALLGGNEVWGLGLSPEQLAEIGTELGSDIPFFFADGPAICRGRGERVEPIAGLGALHFVMARPPAGLSTAAVYGACRAGRQPREIVPFIEALSQGNMKEVGRLMWNRLQPAAEELSPWIERLQNEFAKEDFLGHQMSGSGTSYFGLCRDSHHARRVAKRLEANGVGNVFVVHSLPLDCPST